MQHEALAIFEQQNLAKCLANQQQQYEALAVSEQQLQNVQPTNSSILTATNITKKYLLQQHADDRPGSTVKTVLQFTLLKS